MTKQGGSRARPGSQLAEANTDYRPVARALQSPLSILQEALCEREAGYLTPPTLVGRKPRSEGASRPQSARCVAQPCQSGPEMERR